MMHALRNRLWLLCALLVGSSAVAQDIAVDQARVSEARQALINRMVSEHGFERAELTELLEGAEIDQSILRAISRPAERVVPWYEYRNIFLNDDRIQAGAAFWRDNEARVAAAAERHGVEPEMILAIVGIESLFGERMGRYRVLDALSTLAFAYPPRSSFFASELEAFLIMSEEEGPDVLNALGSYAGAMGAGQFIPSSYRAYAVDGDGDGRRDLWRNWDDILASVANYFSVHGWRAGEMVAVPAGRSTAFAGAEPRNGLDLDTTAGALAAAGYEFDAPVEPDTQALVIGLEQSEDETEYWIGFHNFRVITRYNRSVKYALAAHQLSQAIRQAYDASAEQEL